MDPLDPRHGTYAGWQTHIRLSHPTCEPCRHARREYQRGLDADLREGRTRRTDPQPVREHIDALLTQGMTIDAIAERAGVHPHTVYKIRMGAYPTVSTDHAEWILAVELKPDPHGLVPVTGAARRLRALAWLGWSSDLIAAAAKRYGHSIEAGSFKSVRQARRPQIRWATDVAIRAAYGELSMRLPPRGRGSASLQARARKQGWAPPLAWNDADIDDPDATPIGHYRPPTGRRASHVAARIADLEHFIGNDMTLDGACRELGVTRDALWKWADRHQQRHLYERLARLQRRGGNQHTSSRSGAA